MQLVHFSREPVTELYYCEQFGEDSDYVQQMGSLAKPCGLWISDESSPKSWSAHCRDNEGIWRLAQLTNEVVLAEDACILHLENAVQLDMFTSQYRVRGSDKPWDTVLGPRIDWVKVAEEFQGIFIIPWIKSRGFDRYTYWYTLWDCASGCVWDPRAIASIKVIEPQGVRIGASVT